MSATPSPSPRADLRIAGIVLAAGRSSRMAPRNKLLELVGSQSIVARVAGVALASGADPIIVVTGFEAPRIVEALSDLNVTIVHNPAFEEGLSTSLHAGISALPADTAGALICLGDMPEIEVKVLCALMAAFTGPFAICVPVNHGRRGNPVLWGRSYFAEMLDITGDIGAKALLTRHVERVIEVEGETDSIFNDIDTPADLSRLKQSRVGS